MAIYESLTRVSSEVKSQYEAQPQQILSLRSTAPGTLPQYSSYIYGTVRKRDRLNDPDVLDFSLAPSDASFIKLKRGQYIIVDTPTYPRWFTGYITEEPEAEPLGRDIYSGGVGYVYHYKAASDDYLLNLYSLDTVNLTFVNTTYGHILRTLAERLAPGKFNLAGIQDGPRIAKYKVDSNKVFSDIAKELADAANYRWSAKDGKLFFVPMDLVPTSLTLDWANTHFTPSRLRLEKSKENIVNDAIVFGGVEPQDYVKEYFVGDSFEARYQLMSGVYGLSKLTLLDERFSGNGIDRSKWTVQDTVNNWMQVDSGLLNFLGGNNNKAFDVWLQWNAGIPLEGNFRLTHGEWDFVAASDGVIAALYSTTPSAPALPDTADGGSNDFGGDVSTVPGYPFGFKFNGCLFGIRCAKNGTSTLLNPIINGVVDSEQRLLISEYKYRYVMRTIVNFNRAHRLDQEYSYIDQSGNVGSFGGETQPDTVTYQTWISAIDPETGKVVSTTSWTNTANMSPDVIYGLYTPGVNNDLHASVTNITGSSPLRVSLESKNTINPLYTIKGSGDVWGNQDSFRFVHQTVTGDFTMFTRVISIDDTGENGTNKAGIMARDGTAANARHISILLTRTGGSFSRWRTSTGAATSSSTVETGSAPPYWVRIRRGGNLFVTDVSIDGKTWVESTRQTIALPSTLEVGLVVAAGSGNVLATAEFDTVAWGGVNQTTSEDIGAVPQTGSYRDSRTWQSLLVGPNELDAMDGFAPAATVSESNTGALQRTDTGSVLYNPGQATLEFFRESVSTSSQIPRVSDLIRVSYRRAGVAVARVKDRASINSEALTWLDNGYRSLLKKDLKPPPRTTAECEAAAAALVKDSVYPHYEGDYEQYNGFDVVGEPLSGSVVKVANVPAGEFPGLSIAVVLDVVSEYLSGSTSGGASKDTFKHQISFGRKELFRKQLESSDEETTMPEDSADISAVDVSIIGQAVLPDVVNPELTGYDRNNFYFNLGQPAPADGGFEVRFTNAGWGSEDGKNLALRTDNQTFSLPRTNRSKTLFIRAYDTRNKVKHSEDIGASSWQKLSGTTVSTAVENGPDNKLQQISKVQFGANGILSHDIENLDANGRLGVVSMDVQGPIGEQALLELKSLGGYSSNTPVTFAGGWQRITHSATPNSGGQFQIRLSRSGYATPIAVKVTRVSFEVDRATESMYCRTQGRAYGAISRVSADLRLSLPNIPPAAQASIDTTNVDAPVLTIQLPAQQRDIWGYQVRNSAGVVLQKTDLAESNYDLSWVMKNKSRTISLVIYTYNLLGEFSDPYYLNAVIPTPSVSNLRVDDDTKKLLWEASNASGYIVEVDSVNDQFKNLIYQVKPAEQLVQLRDSDFFNRRWIRVIPYDALGSGSHMTISHIYVPEGVSSFDSDEVNVVPPPPTPTTDPMPPPLVAPFRARYLAETYRNYTANRYRYD